MQTGAEQGLRQEGLGSRRSAEGKEARGGGSLSPSSLEAVSAVAGGGRAGMAAKTKGLLLAPGV